MPMSSYKLEDAKGKDFNPWPKALRVAIHWVLEWLKVGNMVEEGLESSLKSWVIA